MRNAAFHLLRIGLAVTFIWIGAFILKAPELWGTGFIKPWAMQFIPIDIYRAMIGAAWFDIGIGILLLLGIGTWLAAALATFHLMVVLIVSGINETTVRDIGLFAAAGALFIQTAPFSFLERFRMKPQ